MTASDAIADPVGDFCRVVHDVRELSRGIDGARLKVYGRMLAEVVQAQCRCDEGYDPEKDRRVLWVRGVLAAARQGVPGARAVAELEATVEYLLGPPLELCGKDRAAGEAWDS